MTKKAAERFDAKYKIDPSTNCWEWQASKDHGGYGRFLLDGKMVRAHRTSYERHVGPIPDGMHVDHLCRNRGCCNPEHLQPVTQHENNRRSGAAVTNCPQGHPYVGSNLKINKKGARICRECARCKSREYYHQTTRRLGRTNNV